MTDINSYEPQSVEAAKAELIEAFSILNAFRDNIVLVGGWAPYILISQGGGKSANTGHVGSMDVDIGIDHRSLPGIEEVYAGIRAILEKNGYRMRKSANGQDIPHSYEKEINGVFVHIDLLASQYGGTGKGKRHQRVQDVLAFKASGLPLAFEDRCECSIEGNLPNGAKHRADIPVAGPCALITMKAKAFRDDISRIKDGYDIYYLLKNYPGGQEAIIDIFNRFAGHNLIKSSLNDLAFLFREIDAAGPIGVADFMSPEVKRSEDWEAIRRDSFEIVNDFIRKVS